MAAPSAAELPALAWGDPMSLLLCVASSSFMGHTACSRVAVGRGSRLAAPWGIRTGQEAAQLRHV